MDLNIQVQVDQMDLVVLDQTEFPVVQENRLDRLDPLVLEDRSDNHLKVSLDNLVLMDLEALMDLEDLEVLTDPEVFLVLMDLEVLLDNRLVLTDLEVLLDNLDRQDVADLLDNLDHLDH